MSDQSLYKFESLRGSENYTSWVVKIKDLLADQGLLEHIENQDNTKDKDKDKTEEHKKWLERDRRALGMIRIRVSEKLITYVKNAETAHKAWTSLNNAFGVQGLSAMIIAKRKVFRAFCLETDDMEQHLRSIRNTADDLATLDRPIPDMDLAAAILMSLPPSYDSLIDSLDYTKGLKLDVNHVIACILERDRRLKSKNGESAFYSKKGKGKYQMNKHTIGRNECRYCHRHRHYEKDC